MFGEQIGTSFVHFVHIYMCWTLLDGPTYLCKGYLMWQAMIDGPNYIGGLLWPFSQIWQDVVLIFPT